MPDKTVNFGVPGDDARFRVRDDDPAGGGDFVVAETLDASGNPVEVLLRYDDTADEWVYGGPVNMDGNDVTSVGAFDADSVSTTDSSTISVDIPTDYPDLQTAIDDLSKRQVPEGVKIELNIESGHQPDSGIRISNGDFSRFRITSADATVTVSSDFPDDGQFLVTQNAWAPVLDILIDMNGENPNSDAGIIINQNGMFLVTPGSGLINSSFNNLVARNSFVWAEGSKFSGAGNDGIEAQQLSKVQAPDSDVSNCGRAGFFVSRGAVLHAQPNAVATGCQWGVRAARARANVQQCDLSNCERAVQVGRGGMVNALDANLSSASDRGINAFNGGEAIATNADISGCLIGAIAEGGSDIVATGADFSNTSASPATLSTKMSRLTLQNATFDGSGAPLVEIREGGFAQVHGATESGSQITASQTSVGSFNSISSDGIIFAP